MEFTELFMAFAITLVGVLFITSLISSFSNEYSDEIGNETGLFSDSLVYLEQNLTAGFVERGLEYGNSTTPTDGQGTSTDQVDNMLKRAWNSITLMISMIGMVPSLINAWSMGLNIPGIYVDIAKALFWTVFAITLAYLLIIGARRLFK